jgi:hypothetical protein
MKMHSQESFVVTCVIGIVALGRDDESPVEAAFRLIGRHNAPGEYHFPHEEGGEIVVAVEHILERGGSQAILEGTY